MNQKKKVMALGMVLAIIVIGGAVFYALGFSYTEHGLPNNNEPVNKEKTEDALPIDTTPLPTVTNSTSQNIQLDNGDTDIAELQQEDQGNNATNPPSIEKSSEGQSEDPMNNQDETNPPDNNSEVWLRNNELPIDLN